MSLPNPSDFQPAEGFYAPQDGDLLFSLSPVLIGALLLLLIAAAVLGWSMGRRSRPDTDPSQAIYDAIKKAVSAAAGAPRDSVASTARHLKTVLDDRLGAVRRLGHGVSGPYDALDDALEGYGAADDAHAGHGAHPPGEALPAGGAHKVTINARHVVLNTTTAAPGEAHEGHSDDAHADAPHDKPGAGHGPRKRLDAKAQTGAIRTAVHDFADYWSDKPARLKDLREARRQLTSTPPGERPWKPTKSGH